MWPTYPTEMLLERLGNLKDYMFPASPSQSILKLFRNDVTPDANSIVGQFTEANFAGYTHATLTFNAPSLNADNIPVCQSNLCHFQPSADGSDNIIYGIYIVDSTSTFLIVAERFDSPIPMDTVNKAINGVFRTSEPLTNYGWLSVE